jgi:hypothetical protein
MYLMLVAMVIASYSTDKKSGRFDIYFRILKENNNGVRPTGKVKVNQSRYRPGVAQSVPGS